MPTKIPTVQEIEALLVQRREKYRAYDEKRKATKTRIVLWVKNETASLIDAKRGTQSRNEWIENCVLDVPELNVNASESVPQHPPQTGLAVACVWLENMTRQIMELYPDEATESHIVYAFEKATKRPDVPRVEVEAISKTVN